MRLFYDSYSSRLRAEIALLAIDSLAISTTTLYVTDALGGRGTLLDKALLVLWACLPRALAKILGRIERPPSSIGVYAGALSFVGLTALLILAGWELIGSVAPRERPVGLPTISLLFFAWGAGFLVFHARAYRLHDFLLAATFLLGLKEGKPYALAWMPLFFTGLLSSSALRHLLYDAFRDESEARFNLQNARTVALLTTLASSILFLGGYYSSRNSPLFLERSRREKLTLGEPNLAKKDEASKMTEASGWEPGEGGGPSTKERGKRRVGFSHRISLRDLALARFDNRVVLRIQAVGGDPPLRDWRPDPNTLWKGISFSTFDPQLESWVEETEYRQANWPANGKLVRSMERGPLEEGEKAVLLRQHVVAPVLKTIVMPYFTVEVSAENFAMYRESSLGDVLPSPKLTQGSEYSTLVVMLAQGHLPAKSSWGTNAEKRFLDLPPTEELGVDLTRLSQRLFPNLKGSVQEKVEALRSFFSKSFRYSNQALWRAGKSPLGAFLEKERIGDCSYFATASALILRAGGISTRLVAGFLRGTWEEEKRETVIRNRDAHAWVEVYFPGSGWYPLDPTSWVEADPSYRPPPDALVAMAQQGVLSKAGQEVTGFSSPLRPDSPTHRGDDRNPMKISPMSPLAQDAKPKRPDERWSEASTGDDGDSDPVLWIEYSGSSPTERKGEMIAVHSAREGGAFEAPAESRKPGSLTGPERKPQREAATARKEVLGTCLRILLVTFGALVFFFLVLAFLRPRPRPGGKQGESELEPEEESGELEPLTAYLDLDMGSPRDRVIAEYVRLQESLKLTRSQRRPHQTPLEHARAVTRGRQELEEAFLQLHRVLYRAIYANDPVEDHHLATFLRSCRRVRKILV